jgi:hypothetical protein
MAVHLLGRAELGGAEADLRVFVGQVKNRPAVQPGDAERAVGQIGERGAVRAQPRIDARPRHRDLAGGAGRHVADEQAT